MEPNEEKVEGAEGETPVNTETPKKPEEVVAESADGAGKPSEPEEGTE